MTQAKKIDWGRLLPRFLENGLFVFASYALFFQDKYAVDTYQHATGMSVAATHLATGRIVDGVITKALDMLGLHGWDHQALYTFVFLLAITLAATLVSRRLLREIDQPSPAAEWAVNLALCLNFVNVFYMAWLLFVEAAVLLAVGLLLCTLAVLLSTERPVWWRCLLSAAALSLALGCYEAFIGEYAVLCCLLLCVRCRFRFTKKELFALCSYVLTAALAFALYLLTISLAQRVLGFTYIGRGDGFSLGVIWQNAKALVAEQPALWKNAFTLMDDWVLPAFALCMLGFLLYGLIRSRREHSPAALCLWGLVGCACYLSAFATHFITPIFLLTTRTLFPFAALLSGLAVLAVAVNREGARRAICLCLCVFAALTAIYVEDVASDQLITNRFDRQYAAHVEERLKRHEAETGETVTRIAVREDASRTWTYEGYVDRHCRDTNDAARAVDWACVPMINFYTGRSLTQVDMPDEVFDARFGGRDWAEENLDEQLYIEGDTAYLAMY